MFVNRMQIYGDNPVAGRLSQWTRQCRVRGFTLVELLAVIALISVIAAGASLALGGVREDAQAQLAQVEMLEIKKALQQFKRDVGYYPKTEHPADFGPLMINEDADNDGDPDYRPWNPDTARGWRGPYLTREGNGYVDIGNDLKADGDGKPSEGTIERHYAAADPFLSMPDGNYFIWRPCANESSAACDPYTEYGRPYYLFDLDQPARARIVSSGPDGVYGGVNADAHLVCYPNADSPGGKDDIVLCLQ